MDDFEVSLAEASVRWGGKELTITIRDLQIPGSLPENVCLEIFDDCDAPPDWTLEAELRWSFMCSASEPAIDAVIDEGIGVGTKLRLMAYQTLDARLLSSLRADSDLAMRRAALVALMVSDRRAPMWPDAAAVREAALDVAAREGPVLVRIDVLEMAPGTTSAKIAAEWLLARRNELRKEEFASLLRVLRVAPIHGGESLLLDCLMQMDGPIVDIAIDTLAEVGTPAAIGSLTYIQKRTQDENRRQATTRAISRIQTRVGGSPGSLSLASSDSRSGDLSLSDS